MFTVQYLFYFATSFENINNEVNVSVLRWVGGPSWVVTSCDPLFPG